MGTIQNLLKDGQNIRQLARDDSNLDRMGHTICPVCRGSGWELFDKDGYETAKRCTACKGISSQIVQEQRQKSGLPSRYQTGVTIADFSTTIYKEIGGDSDDFSVDKLMKYVRSFIDNFYTWETKGMGLYLHSKTKGSGKSYLASCITNSLIQKYAINVKYVSASELIDRARENDGIRDLQEVRLLVLDDLGAKVTGANWMDDIMFRVIDHRNGNGRVTMYTSNIKPDLLPMDERVVDRINEKSLLLNLPEVAVRNKNGMDTKIDFLKSLNIGGKK